MWKYTMSWYRIECYFLYFFSDISASYLIAHQWHLQPKEEVNGISKEQYDKSHKKVAVNKLWKHAFNGIIQHETIFLHFEQN